MTKFIIALIIFAVTLVIKLAVDYRLWLKGKPNKHILGPAIVFVVLVGCTILSGWKSAPMYFFGWTCLFDPFYALLIGEQWYYLGTTSKLDRLQKKYPILQTLKYVLFIGSVVFFIVK